MAIQQIWTDRRVLAHGPLGLELASVAFFLEENLAAALPNSLSLQVVARVLGVQIGAITLDPLKNGPFSMSLIAPIGGDLNGRIDNLRAIGGNGAPAGWGDAAALGFTVTALGNVTVPLETIVALVPGIGPIAKAAIAILGNKLTIDVAHADVVVHLPQPALAAV